MVCILRTSFGISPPNQTCFEQAAILLVPIVHLGHRRRPATIRRQRAVVVSNLLSYLHSVRSSATSQRELRLVSSLYIHGSRSASTQLVLLTSAGAHHSSTDQSHPNQHSPTRDSHTQSRRNSTSSTHASGDPHRPTSPDRAHRSSVNTHDSEPRYSTASHGREYPVFDSLEALSDPIPIISRNASTRFAAN